MGRRKVCLLLCHPEAGSFNAAVADAYGRGAAAAGHEIRRLDLYALGFDPVIRPGAAGGRPGGLEPDLAAAQATIAWSDHLVLVFPMWWYGPPALLKGFVDRTFVSGWAFRYRPGRLLPEKLLAGRSARAIYTMDTPPAVARFLVGDPVGRALRRGILGFVGFRPVRLTRLGPVRGSSRGRRETWLARVEALGHRGA